MIGPPVGSTEVEPVETPAAPTTLAEPLELPSARVAVPLVVELVVPDWALTRGVFVALAESVEVLTP